ncbi:hypothetical protein HDU92_001466 [Lobulomyces angularis]|nr:hypothetical protein HDU92_001466 [Lobulomyces angularis]
MLKSPRVLSIQSHVVHGYVGNKCSVFTLQILGYDVDPINTVQLSNHTKYKKVTGHRLEGGEIAKLIEGLEDNNLLNEYTHLLTGYQGPSALAMVETTVKKLRKYNPNLIYVMDPVLGDEGKMYVPEECIKIYQSLFCLTNLITPNDYEVELLTGIKVKNFDSAKKALDVLHKFKARTIIITSALLEEFQQNLDGKNDIPQDLCLIGSHQNSTGEVFQFSVRFPKIEGSFTGTGDLFASLLLANIKEVIIKDDFLIEYLMDACVKCLSSMHLTLQKTKNSYLEKKLQGDREDMACRELALIQCKSEIENPPILFKALRIF